MAYEEKPLPIWILRNPGRAASVPLVVGLLGGFVFEITIWEGAFAPFGSVTVAIAALVFGTLAGELLTRSQGSFFMDENGEPGEPFNFNQVRRALSLETAVVAIGTIQWGFGHVLTENLH